MDSRWISPGFAHTRVDGAAAAAAEDPVPRYRPLVRQLLPMTPGGAEVDPVTCYAEDARPVPPDRPWVLANMVTSVDGAATSAGTSGPLGGAADRAAFGAIRAVADVILVAAGTVRAEHYRPAQTPAHQRERRRRRGQADHPRFCVVSGSLDLDPSAALFHPDDDRPVPVVATTAAAPASRRRDLEAVAEVMVLDGPRVDVGALLRRLLTDHGAGIVLCEGGPSLIGQLLADDLLDELCLTLSPTTVGGTSGRIATAAVDGPSRSLVLDRVLEADDLLLLRYHRA